MIPKILLLFFIFSFNLLSASGKVNEADNLFRSSVYKTFQNELSLDRNVDYKEFVLNLRERVLKKDPLVDPIVLKLFKGVDLRESSSDFLYSYIPPPKNGEDFSIYLQNSLKLLKENPKFKGVINSPTISDSLLNGNLPSIHWIFPNGLTLIRMGEPAAPLTFWDNLLGKKPIEPEFQRFIQLLAPKTHLYVNLMKRYGEEGKLSKALESLQKEEENLTVVSLDKNTPFYWQSGEYSNLFDANSFKLAFLDKLKGEEYYFPKNLNDMHNFLNKEINDIHNKYFDNKKDLSVKERQDFIEITYLKILDYLVDLVNPSTMNITCKQGMDRGPSLSVLWILSHGSSDYKELAALFLAEPLLIHNRPSHQERLERMLSALSTIQKNSK